MSDYQYKEIPLTPSIAAGHIVEYLSDQQTPKKRVEITRVVTDRHISRGGAARGNPTGAVRKALSQLLEEKKISNPALGWYLLDAKNTDDSKTDSQLDAPQINAAIVSELIVPQKTIGQGDEVVYIYFPETEKKLAGHESRDWWPCKVGFTAGNLTSRILAQGIGTSMIYPPIVGLAIKTDDGRALERSLHLALGAADAHIPDAIGSEWFKTSPNRVEAWHEKYLDAVKALSGNFSNNDDPETSQGADNA